MFGVRREFAPGANLAVTGANARILQSWREFFRLKWREFHEILLHFDIQVQSWEIQKIHDFVAKSFFKIFPNITNFVCSIHVYKLSTHIPGIHM